jgi:hypothetical protein
MILVACELVLSALAIVAVRTMLAYPSAVPMTDSVILAPWQTLTVLTACLLVVALIIRTVQARIAWELLLGITLFLGVWVYLWALLPIEFALVSAAIITLVQAWMRHVWVHNVFILLGAAGVALNFTFLFPPHILAALLVALAVYDTFAGRPGGVIAQFAASLVHRGIIPGLVIPGSVRGLATLIPEAVRKPDAIFLGAGDLILPLLFVVRAAAVGIMPASIVACGIVCAAAWLGSRGATKPFPALVPLAAGAAVPFFLLMLTNVV